MSDADKIIENTKLNRNEDAKAAEGKEYQTKKEALASKRESLSDTFWKTGTGAIDALFVDKRAKKAMEPIMKVADLARTFLKAASGVGAMSLLAKEVQKLGDKIALNPPPATSALTAASGVGAMSLVAEELSEKASTNKNPAPSVIPGGQRHG